MDKAMRNDMRYPLRVCHDGQTCKSGCEASTTPGYCHRLVTGQLDEWKKDKVIAEVRADLLQRSEFGLAKYGRPLSDRWDVDHAGWLRHMYEELLDAANYAKCMMLFGVGYFRKVRQKALYQHVIAGYGVGDSTPQARAFRLMEEATEAFQAAGCSEARGHEIVSYVFSRAPGSLSEEIGQVGAALCTLAESVGVDAEEQEAAEAVRFIGKLPSDMRKRLAEKLESGMPIDHG